MCILQYFKRDLAVFNITLEALVRICVVFIPNSLNYAYNPRSTTVLMLAFTVFFSVHESSTLIITTAVLCVQIFVEDKVMYLRPVTVVTAIFDIVLIACYVFAISCILVMIRYVGHLQASLKNSNEAQSNLLNGMHEGVLILDKKKLDKKAEGNHVLFANWPAQKLFTQFIGAAGLDEEELMSKLCY